MALNKSSILISILIVTSGFLLCTSLQTENKSNSRRTRSRRVIGPRERCVTSRVIGIHLGTTYSSVAVYKQPEAFDMRYCQPLDPDCAASSFYDTMEAVANEQGNTATPSCVSFTDSGVLIGEPAKAQEAVNSERTICRTLRLIGRRFDDPEVQSYIKTLPYKVVNKEDKPHIEVQFKNGEIKLYSPEEICAMILGKMKEIAEAYMGIEVKTAVILISESHFDSNLRHSIAGFKAAHVGTSTHVAGLFGDLYWFQKNYTALIYDLGGSAFSAVLLEHVHDEDVFHRIAAKDDMHLGGQTFDTRLVDYFVNLIKSKYKKDISNNLVALTMLRGECEKAKISLSSSDRVMIKVQFALADDEVLMFEEILTREMFEELNMDLFNKTIDLVKATLEEGRLEKTEIDRIILVGGSSEIPMIQHLVKNYFGKEPLNVVNPKEAFAFAATQLAGHFDVPSVSNPLVLDYMSIGIETIGGIMEPLIYRAIRLPYLPWAWSRNVTTYYDGQTTMEIKVFEGERLLTKYGHYLGNLQIFNLPPAPRGVTTVEVTVEVYKDESFQVTAEHKATQNKRSIIIPKEERRNDREKINRDHSDYMNYDKEDARVWKNIRFAMSLFQLQPRSMGFGVVNAWDWRVLHPQGMCRPQ